LKKIKALTEADINAKLGPGLVPVKSKSEPDVATKSVKLILAGKPDNEQQYLVAIQTALSNLTRVPTDRMELTIAGPPPTPAPTPPPTSQAPSDPTTQAPSDPTTQAPSDPTTQAPSDPTTQAPTEATQPPSDPTTQAPTDATQPPTDATQPPSDPPVPVLLKRAPTPPPAEWTVTVVIKEPLANIPLYIIIGVISAVALIITVVLIISLNKKKTSPEYQQIDDEFANDKLMTDTVY
jgi:hypothetical protein